MTEDLWFSTVGDAGSGDDLGSNCEGLLASWPAELFILHENYSVCSFGTSNASLKICVCLH